jgi:hypothetical protein
VNQNHLNELAGEILTIPMAVDLFEIKRGPAFFWSKAIELKKSKTLDEVADELGTNRATARRSVRYGKELLEAGLTDPLIELTAPPTQGGRWKLHPRFQTAEVRMPGAQNTGDDPGREEHDGGSDYRKEAM